MKTETVVLPSGKTAQIPVDDHGFVPEDVLIDHFYDIMSGVKTGSETRNPIQDYDDRADVVLPGKLTPRQAAVWWAEPWKYDIEGLDVRGRGLRNVGNRKGTLAKVHAKIPIHCMPSEEAMIRDLIDEAFPDVRELKKLVDNGELVVEVRPQRSPGEYYMTNEIRMNRGDVDYGVLSHEGTHGLRYHDDDRISILTKSAHKIDMVYKGKVKDPLKMQELAMRSKMNIEEACTVAECMARGEKVNTNYYAMVQVFDEKTNRWRNPTPKEAKKMAEEDRKLFTGGRNKALPGDEAIQSVQQNFQDSNIARLKSSKSRKMAINDLAAIDPAFTPVSMAAKKSKVRQDPFKDLGTVVTMNPDTAQTTFFSRLIGRRK